MEYIGIAVIIIIIISFLLPTESSNRYPDGRCYLCRKGHCSSGDTCENCGAEQP